MRHVTDLGVPGIALRLWGWAPALRVMKQLVPLEKLVRLMQRRPGGRPRSAAFERRLEGYLQRRERFPFRPPSNCLERSLGAYRLLCGAGARPELVIGFRHAANGRVEGHVWIVVDGRAVAERAEEVERYTTATTFDADGRRRASAAADALDGIRFRQAETLRGK